MTRSRVLALALAIGAGLGMLGPASHAVARPSMIEPGCEVRDATLTWGFKESFRAYIDGDIANGEWTTSRGATYETPECTWSNGQGRYDADTGPGFVNFLGTVRFTGHDGLLDTTIADPTLIISDDDTAVLLLDVSGPSMEGEQIEAQDVSFVELTGFEVSGDTPRLTLESETEFTADGEAAFPDYQAGTAFDPITVALELDKCRPQDYAGGDDISPPPAPPLLLVVGAVIGPLLLLAGIVVAIVIARRRARA
jgi:hypothetical protein